MRKTVDFKRFSMDFNVDWVQIKGKWNWYEFHLIQFRVEKELMHGMAEIEIALLGFGVRIYWIWNKNIYLKKMDEYEKMIKKEGWSK